MGWATAQVDYANAFVQTKLDEPVYITCPRRYEVPGHVLRLNRSLYGLQNSPFNCFSALSTELQNQGLKQCKEISEPCLFIKKNIMIVVYVDDCIFIGTSTAVIDRGLTILKKNFDLDKEKKTWKPIVIMLLGHPQRGCPPSIVTRQPAGTSRHAVRVLAASPARELTKRKRKSCALILMLK
jgi:hypothetical protein